jgi:hypothetical protein
MDPTEALAAAARVAVTRAAFWALFTAIVLAIRAVTGPLARLILHRPEPA